MMLKCEVCGCEFDMEDAGCCDCGFGCGGRMVKCPECSFHVDLPEEVADKRQKEYEKKTIYGRLEDKLKEDNLL